MKGRLAALQSVWLIPLLAWFSSSVAFGQVPQYLSEWGVFQRAGTALELSADHRPYQVINPLYSDGAVKLRTVALPAGTQINYRSQGVLDFPDGTLLTKTFGYQRDQTRFPAASGRTQPDRVMTVPGVSFGALAQHYLLETRLLWKRGGRWIALPYVWDAQQQDAQLSLIGGLVELEVAGERFDYEIPNGNQCRSCHIEQRGFQRRLLPIGPTAAELNRLVGTDHQLEQWAAQGILSGLPPAPMRPRNPSWQDLSGSLEQRAAAYLSSQCAHCHNPYGSALNSGLFLQFGESRPQYRGLCKSPIAAGDTGGRTYVIAPGDPSDSILIWRMESGDPDIRMPELGRSLTHIYGVELMEEWVAQLTGDCSLP